MPKHPTAYEQGLQDGFLIPMVFSLEEEMDERKEEYLSHDILERAGQYAEASDEALRDAGNVEDLVLAQTLAAQAAACALISIGERLDMLATTAHDELERKLRAKVGERPHDYR